MCVCVSITLDPNVSPFSTTGNRAEHVCEMCSKRDHSDDVSGLVLTFENHTTLTDTTNMESYRSQQCVTEYLFFALTGDGPVAFTQGLPNVADTHKKKTTRAV